MRKREKSMRQFQTSTQTLARIGLAGASALALSACATYSADDPLDFGTRLVADLDGANEVPKLGDPDGSGDFVAALNAEGRMCYEMEARGTDLITAAISMRRSRRCRRRRRPADHPATRPACQCLYRDRRKPGPAHPRQPGRLLREPAQCGLSRRSDPRAATDCGAGGDA